MPRSTADSGEKCCELTLPIPGKEITHVQPHLMNLRSSASLAASRYLAPPRRQRENRRHRLSGSRQAALLRRNEGPRHRLARTREGCLLHRRPFKKAGIAPADGKSYYQRFSVTTNAKLGKENQLSPGSRRRQERSAAPDQDFQPFNFSGNGNFDGPGRLRRLRHHRPRVRLRRLRRPRRQRQDRHPRCATNRRSSTRKASSPAKSTPTTPRCRAKPSTPSSTARRPSSSSTTHPTTPSDPDDAREVLQPCRTQLPRHPLRPDPCRTSPTNGWPQPASTLKSWIAEVDKDTQARGRRH